MLKVMVYPNSPFIKLSLNTISDLYINNQIGAANLNENHSYIHEVLQWLCTTPNVTSIRVNTIKCSVDAVKDLLDKTVAQIFKTQNVRNTLPATTIHPKLHDVILLNSYENENIKKQDCEVIVDGNCGAAVLRGANIFAPGVLAMEKGTKRGDIVSVYADLEKCCKRGFATKYDSKLKVFLGNGKVKMQRYELFGKDINPSGIAIEMTEVVSGCLNINESILPTGSILLQNIPSIVCGHILNPESCEVVLDMCAAPGNKTTHLAALMENKGTLVAVDKTENKVKQLRKKCEEFSVNNATIFEFDSTKLCNKNLETKFDVSILSKGPPFPVNSFDKILLDAPCSGLGTRPQLVNTITDKVVKSYVPLQRKLFENAVHLLKPGGHLVYSTCTITLAENEGLVAWALENFKFLELKQNEPVLGGPGWDGTTLTQEQLNLVQRFGPNQIIDSIGFFIALFVKKS